MLWPSTSLKISVLTLFLAGNIPGLLSEGSVGCLYSERICLEEEWCYNDLVFGRCVRSYGDVDEDDLYRFFLERENLHELNNELRKLFALGYRWNHGYTQCRLQAILYAIKQEMTFEPNSCSHLTDSDLEGALTALEGKVDLDPREIAVIKYTPSIENSHAPFADEVFYPPNNNKERDELRQKILPLNAVDLDLPDPYAYYDLSKRAWIPQMKRRSSEKLDFLPGDDFPDLTAEEIEEVYATIEFLKDVGLPREEISDLLRPENYDKLEKLIDTVGGPEGKPKDVQDMLREELEAEKELENAAEITRFNEKLNSPDDFRAGWESKDGFPESRIYFDEGNDEEENSEYGSGNIAPQPIFRERQQSQGDGEEVFGKLKEHTDQSAPGVYSEGGVVWSDPVNIKNDLSDRGEPLLRSNWDNLLTKYNQAFKRPERLDVKKPGPLFSTGNYKIEATKPTKPVMMKKEPRGVHPNPDFEQIRKENQGSQDYVYISFKSDLVNWRHGRHIMGNLSEILKLDPKTLDDSRVFGDYIVFRVLPNSRGLNATEVAKEIVSTKSKIEKVAELEVKSVFIGNRENKEIEIMAATYYTDQFYVIIFMICGVLGAMIIASALLIFIRKHVKLRDKLQGLVKFDTEAVKVHPEAGKTKVMSKGQLAGDTMHSRLSKESEQSPSSRSSTSSWTEEPALHNMDISTGHMVLSYMEDHLKNKDRLEQEWVALCAYVAEPCEISIAAKKSNKPNNRYPEVVPYDHARVVLNDLINVNGSDYINASSITDHDPRNPAYIATQGPLPHTTPDFWQLIWEQGAVVIVMLTRLTEGGAAMCHRYWPEEGSELYHIYEVHLVSEHIWCDDYLVRSFYLKNIRTGETRTVTQFHFLSWPESGIPASTKALLEFRRKVNKSYRGRSCPIVVHCNDGSGRTGTYCLIDMVLSRMAKGAKEIDIAATLEHLRDQRPRMVATKQQFEFVLTAVAEEVHAILKALPPQPGPAQAPDKEK